MDGKGEGLVRQKRTTVCHLVCGERAPLHTQHTRNTHAQHTHADRRAMPLESVLDPVVARRHLLRWLQSREFGLLRRWSIFDTIPIRGEEHTIGYLDNQLWDRIIEDRPDVVAAMDHRAFASAFRTSDAVAVTLFLRLGIKRLTLDTLGDTVARVADEPSLVELFSLLYASSSRRRRIRIQRRSSDENHASGGSASGDDAPPTSSPPPRPPPQPGTTLARALAVDGGGGGGGGRGGRGGGGPGGRRRRTTTPMPIALGIRDRNDHRGARRCCPPSPAVRRRTTTTGGGDDGDIHETATPTTSLGHRVRGAAYACVDGLTRFVLCVSRMCRIEAVHHHRPHA